MKYKEAETRFLLIAPVMRGKGFDAHWRLKLETPAPVEPTGNKSRRRIGAGRTDYPLCMQAIRSLKTHAEPQLRDIELLPSRLLGETFDTQGDTQNDE